MSASLIGLVCTFVPFEGFSREADRCLCSGKQKRKTPRRRQEPGLVWAIPDIPQLWGHAACTDRDIKFIQSLPCPLHHGHGFPTSRLDLTNNQLHSLEIQDKTMRQPKKCIEKQDKAGKKRERSQDLASALSSCSCFGSTASCGGLSSIGCTDFSRSLGVK